MNKKGTIILGVMWFTFAVITAIIIMPSLLEIVTEARAPANLNCVATNLTTGTAMTCAFIDIAPAIFFLAVVGSSLALIKLTS